MVKLIHVFLFSFNWNFGVLWFLSALAGRSSDESPPQSVQTELIMLSLPAIVGQAIEPLAQLMETAYIGRLGKLFLLIHVNLFTKFFYVIKKSLSFFKFTNLLEFQMFQIFVL